MVAKERSSSLCFQGAGRAAFASMQAKAARPLLWNQGLPGLFFEIKSSRAFGCQRKVAQPLLSRNRPAAFASKAKARQPSLPKERPGSLGFQRRGGAALSLVRKDGQPWLAQERLGSLCSQRKGWAAFAFREEAGQPLPSGKSSSPCDLTAKHRLPLVIYRQAIAFPL